MHGTRLKIASDELRPCDRYILNLETVLFQFKNGFWWLEYCFIGFSKSVYLNFKTVIVVFKKLVSLNYLQNSFSVTFSESQTKVKPENKARPRSRSVYTTNSYLNDEAVPVVREYSKYEGSQWLPRQLSNKNLYLEEYSVSVSFDTHFNWFDMPFNCLVLEIVLKVNKIKHEIGFKWKKKRKKLKNA